IMAGAMGRPVVLAEDAEGTALGAAALARFAVGEAPTLLDAVQGLSFEQDDTAVEASADDVALYAGLRRSVPALLDAYDEMREHLAAVQSRTALRGGAPAPVPAAPDRPEGPMPSALPE